MPGSCLNFSFLRLSVSPVQRLMNKQWSPWTQTQSGAWFYVLYLRTLQAHRYESTIRHRLRLKTRVPFERLRRNQIKRRINVWPLDNISQQVCVCGFASDRQRLCERGDQIEAKNKGGYFSGTLSPSVGTIRKVSVHKLHLQLLSQFAKTIQHQIHLHTFENISFPPNKYHHQSHTVCVYCPSC